LSLAKIGSDWANLTDAIFQNDPPLDTIHTCAKPELGNIRPPATLPRFCGGFLSYISASTAAATVFTAQQPFTVGVYTDGLETDTTTSGTTEMSGGFNLYYSQVAC